MAMGHVVLRRTDTVGCSCYGQAGFEGWSAVYPAPFWQVMVVWRQLMLLGLAVQPAACLTNSGS